jgi:thiamine-phosphate pyrophosphorylase
MRKTIESFHFLTRDLPDVPHEQQVHIACKAGVRWVQLRVKNKQPDELLKIALSARKLTAAHGVTLIINDNPEIAVACRADGVHLGQRDMRWNEARAIMGADKIIGYSTHSFRELKEANSYDVDYFGLGPLHFTTTKKNLDEVLGFGGIREIMSEAFREGISKPVIAIGGIQPGDVVEILSTGVKGIAVSSAIDFSSEPEATIQKFQFTIENFYSKTETITG